MDSGYYAACSGLAAQTQALELVANNLANLSTAGYRSQQATFRSLLTGSGWVSGNPLNAAINDYGVLSGTRTDLKPANLTATGNPLDMAIEGKGFFTVQLGQKTLYTRDGSFHVTPNGQLVTAEGATVLADTPLLGARTQVVPVVVPSGQVAVSSDGTISVNGAVVAKLRIADFPANVNPQAEGNTLYSAPIESETAANSVSVRQGMLENSNANAMLGIVQLITVQRNAETLQRALSLFDSVLNQSAAQDLPRV